ncbi:MAG: hypothetical protein ACREQ7_21335 [Candidatus Binatia bacterium]
MKYSNIKVWLSQPVHYPETFIARMLIKGADNGVKRKRHCESGTVTWRLNIQGTPTYRALTVKEISEGSVREKGRGVLRRLEERPRLSLSYE